MSLKVLQPQPTSEAYFSVISRGRILSLLTSWKRLPTVVSYHMRWRPREGTLYDWHKWLHLRWWKIWITTTKCSACHYGRLPYSVTEKSCWVCQTTNFGYPLDLSDNYHRPKYIIHGVEVGHLGFTRNLS